MTERSASKEQRHKCLECPFIPCINFRRITEEGVGELYVLETLHGQYPPCHSGVLIYVICQLHGQLPQLPSYRLLLQSIRDLRTSAFLLITGHYRASLIILRSVLETFLAGLYFDYKYLTAMSDEERANVSEQIERFYKEEYEVPEEELKEVSLPLRRKRLDYHFLLEWLYKRRVISGSLKNKIGKIINEVNDHIHVKRLEVIKPSCPKCPSLVKVDLNEYANAIRLFQDVASILIEILLEYIELFAPSKFETGEIDEILGYLITEEKLENELKVRLVFSERLRALINRVKG